MPVSQIETSAIVAAIEAQTKEVQGLRAEIAVYNTKLFGDAAGENPQGRVPRIEATQKDHGRRIRVVERRLAQMAWVGSSVILVVLAISKLTEFVYHIFGIAGH